MHNCAKFWGDTVLAIVSPLTSAAPVGQTANTAQIHKTELQKPQTVRPHSPGIAAVSPIDPTHQATLIFTASHLARDYRGASLGTGSLRLYEPGGQCEYPPKALAFTQNVNADHPVVLLTIPAGQPLVLASFWSSGAAHCVVGNYNFVPKENTLYRLTNMQNRHKGICSLRLQRLAKDRGRYVEDYSLVRSKGQCDRQVSSNR